MVIHLIQKEYQSEIKKRFALHGLLLYLIMNVFVVYFGTFLFITNMNSAVWNTLFWIILFFSASQLVAKSFFHEQQGLQYYWYQMASPTAIILSKMIYYGVFLYIFSLLGWFIYGLLMKNPVNNSYGFGITLFLTTFGISSTLSFVSSIAAKAGNNSILLAVLSLPTLLPLLITGIQTGFMALQGVENVLLFRKWYLIASIDLINILLAYILFPFIWRS